MIVPIRNRFVQTFGQLIVDTDTLAEKVVDVIHKAGGKLLSHVRLFDIHRGEQIGTGKKSMAYSLTYQTPDRTLTYAEAAKVRQRIVQALGKNWAQNCAATVGSGIPGKSFPSPWHTQSHPQTEGDTLAPCCRAHPGRT
jgi:Ferredoxin-fold anticodon binding domain